MCSAPDIPPPAPAPAPPPVLEQLAPKSAKGKTGQERKKMGMSRYKTDLPTTASSIQLGGIPQKTGV